jgi:hypothetical protein
VRLPTLSLVAIAACGSHSAQQHPDGSIAADAKQPDAMASYTETVLVDHPLSYWRLGETSGTYAHDQMSSAEPGTYTNVTVGQPGATADGDTSIQTSGGGYVDIADAYRFTGNVPFSLEAWVRPTTSTVFGPIIEKTSSTQTATYGYLLELDNGAPWMVRYVANVDGLAKSTSLVGLKWAHVITTYDGQQIKIYVNGGIKAQATTSSPMSSDFGNLRLGGLDGLLDEVAIYDHVLPGDGILAHCEAARNPDVTCAP